MRLSRVLGRRHMSEAVPLAAVALASLLEWGGKFDCAFVSGKELTVTGLGRAGSVLGRDVSIEELGHLMSGLQAGGLTWFDAERILAD